MRSKTLMESGQQMHWERFEAKKKEKELNGKEGVRKGLQLVKETRK